MTADKEIQIASDVMAVKILRGAMLHIGITSSRMKDDSEGAGAIILNAIAKFPRSIFHGFGPNGLPQLATDGRTGVDSIIEAIRRKIMVELAKEPDFETGPLEEREYEPESPDDPIAGEWFFIDAIARKKIYGISEMRAHALQAIVGGEIGKEKAPPGTKRINMRILAEEEIRGEMGKEMLKHIDLDKTTKH